MALKVRCCKCKGSLWVRGYSTPDTFHEPGEVVTELAPLNGADLCQCLMDGEEYEIVDEDIDDSGEDY